MYTYQVKKITHQSLREWLRDEETQHDDQIDEQITVECSVNYLTEEYAFSRGIERGSNTEDTEYAEDLQKEEEGSWKIKYSPVECFAV